MATKTTYQKKLLDPRWQKKRLEILNRDNFSCQICGDTTRTLVVHHKNYIYGNEPWDYIDNNFITLCESCHEYEHYYKDEVFGRIHDFLLMGHTYTSLANIIDQNLNLFIDE